jgi:TM2 domain-containing membrane protein YozV
MKSKWIAGVLSFVFPGLGHLYLGQVKKGVILILVHIVSIVLTAFVIGIFTMVAVWIYAIINSVKQTELVNGSLSSIHS